MNWPAAWQALDKEEVTLSDTEFQKELQKELQKEISTHQIFVAAGLAHWLLQSERAAPLEKAERMKVVALSGAQGSGKSTLASVLQATLSREGQSVALLSLDDFYLSKTDREVLSRRIHPLLITRGVPGTHDLPRLLKIIRSLRQDESVSVPVFDKLSDDRLPESRSIQEPVDWLILEGWCLGAGAADEKELLKPINSLERSEDADARWRCWVNDYMKGAEWKALHELIDVLVYLQVPKFDQVFNWRLQQEKELALNSHSGYPMTSEQLTRFIHHFERITRQMMRDLPDTADLVCRQDADHSVVEIRENSPDG